MQRFDRWENQLDEMGNRRTRQELDEMEAQFNEQQKLEQQLKFKQMTKLITSSIVGLFLMVFLFKSCERIDAGHVGVKVNQYGDNKGVDDVVAVTGMVFFNPLTTRIYEFPTFIQHKEYKGDDSFIVNS